MNRRFGAIARAVLLIASLHGAESYDPRHANGPTGCRGEPSGSFQPCFRSQCCASPGFVCLKSAARPDSAQCRPMVAHGGATCRSSADWLCPDEWRPPFAPPLPPPPPVPKTTRLPSCVAGKTPSEEFSPCFESKCCKGSIDAAHGFGCFKRSDRAYAQCRPMAAHRDSAGNCADSDSWLCPTSWLPPDPKPSPSPPPRPPSLPSPEGCLPGTQPAAQFAACFSSRCCEGQVGRNGGFGCFRKPGKSFAQCRPMALHRDHSGTCKDSTDWLCPASWITYPPPPPPRPPPSPSPPPVKHQRPSPAPPCAQGESPAEAFSACYASQCCKGAVDADHGIGCFKKPGRAYAQCRPIAMHRDADGNCVDNDSWQCPASWLGVPPSPPASGSPSATVQYSKAGLLASKSHTAATTSAAPLATTRTAPAREEGVASTVPTVTVPHGDADHDYTLYTHGNGGAAGLSEREKRLEKEAKDFSWMGGAIALGVVAVCVLLLLLAIVIMRGRGQREEVQREMARFFEHEFEKRQAALGPESARSSLVRSAE